MNSPIPELAFEDVDREHAEDPFRWKKLWRQYIYTLTLTPSRKDTIYDYTVKGFGAYNAPLRRGEEQEVNLFDKIFLEAPPIREPLTVYRAIGERFNPEINTYVSTSFSPYILNLGGISDERDYLRITIPAGSRVVPAAFVAMNPDEYEIILPRNLKKNEANLIPTASQEITMKRCFDCDRPPYKKITMRDLIYLSKLPVYIDPESKKKLPDSRFLSALEKLVEFIEFYPGRKDEIENTSDQELQEHFQIFKDDYYQRYLDFIDRYFVDYIISQRALEQGFDEYGLYF